MVSSFTFEQLPIAEKAKLISMNGEYIDNRKHKNFKLNLYSIYGYFVEIWYNEDLTEIKKIEVVKSNKVIDVYIDKIDLSDLM